MFYLALSLVALLVLVFWLKSKSRSDRSESPVDEDLPPLKLPLRIERSAVAVPRPAEPNIDKDAWEGSFWDVEVPMLAKATLQLSYVDGYGGRTERTVDVKQFGRCGPTTLLIGHCRMRNATRTFRTDRIQRCVDVSTGEILTDVDAFLRRIYESSPERTRDQLLDAEYDVLRILLYVGKADGQLRKQEKQIIRDACVALAKDSRLTDELIDEVLASLDVPTLQAFKLAAGRLVGRSSEAKQALISAAVNMVGTQKTVHPAEQEALDYLRKKLLA